MPSPPGANLLTGLGLDEVFTRTAVTGTRAFLPDALGSTLALSDPTGAITAEYTYEPFRGTAVTGAPGTSPFRTPGARTTEPASTTTGSSSNTDLRESRF